MGRPSRVEIAEGYLERGWSVIPIKPDTKRPAVKWREFAERQPTVEEVTEWWDRWPHHDIALVTGAVSGVVVVDCDSELAQEAALEAGMESPIQVKTKRGVHLYFRHPMDGIRRGPRAGVNSRGADWPKIPGLDFRGDGSYAVLPPTDGYDWDYPDHVYDWQHDMPTWRDWKPSSSAAVQQDGFHFEALDLSEVDPFDPDDRVSEWDVTARFVMENFPTTKKIPTGLGNGRNERLMRYVSQSVLDGCFGDALRVRGYAFMNEFFEEHLPEAEFEATLRSIEEAERRNHPERFDEEGNYIYKRAEDYIEEVDPAGSAKRLIQMSDAEQLLAESGGRSFFIEPWLPTGGTIVQVHGFSGSGKSMFLQHALGALCSGRKYFGPFELGQPARVLYLDFEMGMATVAKRLMWIREVHGDTEDRLNIWTPFVDSRDINLNSKDGLLLMQEWVERSEPDIVVIDTIRSGYPGLQENSSEEWAKINRLAIRLRNTGMAVILVHHSNKPGESGLGREAGSSNQLTALETQIRIAQVYRDEDDAKQNGGVWDGGYDRSIWDSLEGQLPGDFIINMVMEVKYGKVREWTDLHDRTQWIGFAEHAYKEERIVVSSRSTKQRAKEMALHSGMDPSEIAKLLRRPSKTIRDWLGL